MVGRINSEKRQCCAKVYVCSFHRLYNLVITAPNPNPPPATITRSPILHCAGSVPYRTAAAVYSTVNGIRNRTAWVSGLGLWRILFELNGQ